MGKLKYKSKETTKKEAPLDEFLLLMKKEYKDAPFAIVKRIGDHIFTFRVRKK